MVDCFPFNDFNIDAENSKETDDKDSDDDDEYDDEGGECDDDDDDDDNDDDDDEYSLMLTHCSSRAGAGLQRARVQL